MTAGAPVLDAAAEVKRFFEERAPALLREGDAAAAGGIDGRCLIDVGESGKWLADFTTDPPTIALSNGPAAIDPDCTMSVTAQQLLELIADPTAGQVLAWQGRLQMTGDQAMLRRVGEVLFPAREGENTAMSGYYASISRLIPDPRLTFMNYGYVDDGEDFSWCADADWTWRYAINLIRRTLAGISVADARVLDVGCGRGGPAAYIAQRCGAAEVVGLDASADGVQFCQREHAHPNLRFVHGSAEGLPFADESFDVVLNVESSHCYLHPAVFFSEVARVLRPGGAFCYADILLPEQFAHMQRLLVDTPGLAVGPASNISAQVAQAIELNRTAFAALMQSATDGKLSNQALIANLVRTVNRDAYERLRTGRVGYYAWTIQKEG